MSVEIDTMNIKILSATLPFFYFKKGALFCLFFFVSVLLKKGIFGKKVPIEGVSQIDFFRIDCCQKIPSTLYSTSYRVPIALYPFTRHLTRYL